MGNFVRRWAGALAFAIALPAGAQTTLLNVSYDVAREFYRDVNAAFTAHYLRKTGIEVRIEQSHAGSSAQARAVADGLEADVVTMNTTTDVDFLAERGSVAKDWRQRFPNNASPGARSLLRFVGRRARMARHRDRRTEDGLGSRCCTKNVRPGPYTTGERT